MRKKLFSDGKKRNLDLDFEIPFNQDVKLSGVDGGAIPFIMQKRNKIRFTKDIPVGDVFLDYEEMIPAVRPVQLDTMQLSLIKQKDIDRLNLFAQELGVKEAIIKKKEIDINNLALAIQQLETNNSQKIDENAVAFKLALDEVYKSIALAQEEGKRVDDTLAKGIFDAVKIAKDGLDGHLKATNPHNITKGTVGLGNVDNTSDMDKPVSKAVQKELDKKLDKEEASKIREEIKKSEKKVMKISDGIANMTGGVAQLELPRGGKEGQILSKKSNKDGDFEWVSAGGSVKHVDTTGRDSANQHPIQAITGLENALNEKQDVIEDLEAIRSDASDGKEAKDTIDTYGDIVSHNVSEFATASQGAKADTAVQNLGDLGITATATELNYTDGVTGNIQTQLDGKATSSQGAKADSALQPSDVKNNVVSTDTDKPLSANMGKELQDQINNLKARGRYLSVWNCTTGLAGTTPVSPLPYDYKAGDYFIVGVVGATNYKPNGSQYTGNPSTTVETNTVNVNDTYYYDGSSWSLLSGGGQVTATFGSLGGSPYDNANLSNALNSKQDLISLDNKSITYNEDNELQTVGVIDQNNTSTALKQWSGTLAGYNAIATKDPDTIYHITDDNTAEAFDAYSKAETDLLLAQKQNTGVSYTKAETDTKILDMLKLVYPVNSMYLSTASTCPLQALFGTWTKVGTSILTNVTGSNSVPVKGNGKAMTWTCGSSGEGACACNGTFGTWAQRNTVGSNYNVGDTLVCNSVLVVDKAMGLSQTASRSGIIADISGSLTKSSLTVNIFKRTA